MSEQQPLLPAEPFYKSPVFTKLVGAGISQFISLVLRIAKMMGHEIEVNMEDVQSVSADAAQFIAFAFIAWAAMSRKNSAVHPLTMTAAGADKQNEANPPMLATDPTKTMAPQQTATMSDTPKRPQP